MKAWINDELLPTPEVHALSVLDHGLIVGDGVFETIQILAGQPFALTRHLDRLTRSALGLGLAAPDLELVRRGIEQTVDLDIAFGRIRVTVTSGPGPLGSPRGSGPQTVVVASEACARPAPTTSIVTVPWVRNERGPLAGLKTTSYADNALMLAYATERGASEAVMANTLGNLCEGTGTNLFYVVDGELRTPPLSSGCLAGITRSLVLDWMAEVVAVAEVDAPIDVLDTADEIFLTSSIRDVQSVGQVDQRVLEAPGPVTRKAAEVFASMAAAGMDPAP